MSRNHDSRIERGKIHRDDSKGQPRDSVQIREYTVCSWLIRRLLDVIEIPKRYCSFIYISLFVLALIPRIKLTLNLNWMPGLVSEEVVPAAKGGLITSPKLQRTLTGRGRAQIQPIQHEIVGGSCTVYFHWFSGTCWFHGVYGVGWNSIEFPCSYRPTLGKVLHIYFNTNFPQGNFYDPERCSADYHIFIACSLVVQWLWVRGCMELSVSEAVTSLVAYA